jgi:hypothetical protein
MVLFEVIGEVGPLEGAVTAGRLVEDFTTSSRPTF